MIRGIRTCRSECIGPCRGWAVLSNWPSRTTSTVLSVVLSRIYTLRNQVLHGGATWGSSVNREQLRDCTNFMAKLVPLVIEVMMDHPDTLWGVRFILW